MSLTEKILVEAAGEQFLYHGLTKGELSGNLKAPMYFGDADLADAYASGEHVIKVRNLSSRPYVVSSFQDFQPIYKDVIEPTVGSDLKWHPDVSNMVVDYLQRRGFDSLVITESAFDSEEGYEFIGGTYGEPQTVIFDAENIQIVE